MALRPATAQEIEQLKTKSPFIGSSFSPKSTDTTSGLQDFSIGVGKGILETVKGAGNIGAKIGNTLLQPLGIQNENVYSEENLQKSAQAGGVGKLLNEENLSAENTGEKIGKTVEKIAEFLAPSTKIANIEKAATGLVKGSNLGARAARTLVRSGIEAGSNAGITTVQEGGVNDKVKTAAIVSAIFPTAIGLGQEAKRGIGSGVQKLGEKIQTNVIKPSVRDVKDGFKLENIKKYGVGGLLAQTVAKTHIKINQLSNELKTKLKDSTGTVNLNQVYDDTIKALTGDKKLTFGDNQGIQRVLENLKGEIGEVGAQNGSVNVYDATLIKRGAGTKGAWSFGRMEPDANATEKVYSTFYSKIKDAIEKSSPSEIKEINKQISELIPISNAAIRRLPVEQRNNVIGLTDSIGIYGALFDPRELALIGASRLSKSGRFANFLVNTGERMKRTIESKTSVGKRIFGK